MVTVVSTCYAPPSRWHQLRPPAFDALQFAAGKLLFGEAELVGLLEVEPEIGGRAEENGEAERRVAGDAAPARSAIGIGRLQDRGDPVGRDADRVGQCVGAEARRRQEFLFQYFSRRNRAHAVPGHACLKSLPSGSAG